MVPGRTALAIESAGFRAERCLVRDTEWGVNSRDPYFST
jgi:hypothetical protein